MADKKPHRVSQRFLIELELLNTLSTVAEEDGHTFSEIRNPFFI